MILFKLLIVFNLVLMFSGCSSRTAIPYPDYEGVSKGYKTRLVVSDPLPVYGWFPDSMTGSEQSVVRIYIEGDGRGWIRRGRPAMDSTPKNRLVHYLMRADTGRNIAYLGRPCQYVQSDGCTSRVWTFDRYSQYVVDVMNRAVDEVKVQGGYLRVELVGYSGGGTIALLLAARRNDVVSIRTVAGNLDPAYLNRLHGVSEMPDALIPRHYQDKLVHIPQVHFYGMKDSVVPASVSEYYAKAIKGSACIRRQAVNADHRSGWVEKWSDLLKVEPEC